MSTILEEICDYKREVVKTAKGETPIGDLRDAIDKLEPPRDFRFALRKPGLSLIAEVKKASPVKGRLRTDQDLPPAELAALYERCGASAISVLTEDKYFMGTLKDLANVRRTVRVPCLRKDFIVDEYQIYEARAAQADAILLIVRSLSDAQLKEYHEIATQLGMGVLVETHDAAEIERALAAGAHIIGINNRDLNTFEVNVDTTLELKKLVPGGNVLVSESGIHSRDEVRKLEDGGVDAVLIGEALVTSNDIRAKIYELLHDDS